MPKKRHEDEHEGNNERWLLTYSDMITLLMIFFIVMYSMSQVDKAKFTAVAQQLSIVMGGGSATVLTDTGAGIVKDMPPSTLDNEQMDEAEKNLEEYIVQNGLGTMAKIYRDERGLIISLNEGLLFELGSAEVDKPSKEILAKIASSVKPMPNFIRIEGFTDNIPIKTARFDSNWELASQRAINVAKIIMENGIAGERISTVSYGEYRPMYPNDTDEHKRFNRKVDIIVINQANDKLEPKTSEKQ